MSCRQVCERSRLGRVWQRRSCQSTYRRSWAAGGSPKWQSHGPWLHDLVTWNPGWLGFKNFKTHLYIMRYMIYKHVWSYLDLIWSRFISSINCLQRTVQPLAGLVNWLHFGTVWYVRRLMSTLSRLTQHVHLASKLYDKKIAASADLKAWSQPNSLSCSKATYVAITYQPSIPIFLGEKSRKADSSWLNRHFWWSTPSCPTKRSICSTAAPLPIPGHRAWPVVEGLSQAQKVTRNDA